MRLPYPVAGKFSLKPNPVLPKEKAHIPATGLQFTPRPIPSEHFPRPFKKQV